MILSDIPHLSKAKLSLYSQLSQVKMRRRHGLFIAEGAKCVADTLPHFQIEALVVMSGADIPDALVRCGAPMYEVCEREMERLSSLSTVSNIVAVYHVPEPTEVQVSDDHLYVMLDGVQDPGNLGTIVRTCHWFGIDTIFASHDTVDIYNPKTVQATMGSVGAVSMVYCNLPEVVAAHPTMPVYGLLLNGRDIYKADLEQRGFIVMGNEGKGLSGQMRECVTDALLIPPAGENHGESLNVAIATAITLSIFAVKRR